MNKKHFAALTSIVQNTVLITAFIGLLSAFSAVQAQQSIVENPMVSSAPIRYGSYSNSVTRVPSQPTTTTSTTPVKTSRNSKKEASTGTVNINSASETDLVALPGIGPSKAKAIAEYRQQKGGFKSIDDLKQVKGIGPATLEKLRAHVSL